MPLKANEYNIPKLIVGDRLEFKFVYNDFFDVIFNIGFQYTRSKNVAEEIAQDVFLKLWEIRSTLKHDSNIKNFLYILARNKCLNYLRDHIKERKINYSDYFLEMQFNYEALNELPSDYIEFEECYKIINAAINKLPVDIKETFRMSRFEGLPNKEIAEKYNVGIKAIEARMTKALMILRKELKDYLPEY